MSENFSQHDLIVVHKPTPDSDKIPVGKVGTIVGFAVRFPGQKGLWIVQGNEIRRANEIERDRVKAPVLEMLFRDPEEAVRQGIRQVVARAAPAPLTGVERASAASASTTHAPETGSLDPKAPTTGATHGAGDDDAVETSLPSEG